VTDGLTAAVTLSLQSPCSSTMPHRYESANWTYQCRVYYHSETRISRNVRLLCSCVWYACLSIVHN